MTLLVSLYTSCGIVFAADSAITVDGSHGAARVAKQEKFLRTKRLGINGGIVGYFGLAQVGNDPMDVWLRRTLDKWDGSPFPADLGDYLCDQLNRSVPRSHRTGTPSGFHIGAFERRAACAVPVFHYVWNYRDLDQQSGIYRGFGDYISQEHFPRNHEGWKATPPRNIRAALRRYEREEGIPFWFRNGQLAFSARAWMGLTWAIADIAKNLEGGGFRLPDSLERWEQLADTLVRTNGRLFALMQTRGAPTIEGPYRKTSIPWP